MSMHKEIPSYLNLYFIPSPYGIDWSSPRGLFTSIAKNYFAFQKHFMGHVQVEQVCQEDPSLNFFAGMRSDQLNAKGLIFLKQVGLGIVFHKFAGQLESEVDKAATLQRLTRGKEKTRPCCFLTFQLNLKQCQRLKRYHQLYRDHNLGRYYGLHCRPIHGEGAGCSAFATSFLQQLGLVDQQMQQAWGYHLRFPKELTGAPVYDHKVAPWKFLTKIAKSWPDQTREGENLFFWEPDRMIDWVLMKIKSDPQNKIEYNGCQGYLIDASQCEIPNEPLFKPHNERYFPELNQFNHQLLKDGK